MKHRRIKQYVKPKYAARITGLDKRVLNKLVELGYLETKVEKSRYTYYGVRDLRKIKFAVDKGARTARQVQAKLDEPKSKYTDILWLRASDSSLPKLNRQKEQILDYCKLKGIKLKFREQDVYKELGSERKPERYIVDDIIDRVEDDDSLKRIFVWDRSRIFRGCAIRWVERHCLKHGVELIVIEDLLNNYTEEMKVKLDEKNELDSFYNGYRRSEQARIEAEMRKERRRRMSEVAELVRLKGEAGDVEAQVLLKQYEKGYTEKRFTNDFIAKANGF